MNNTLTKIIEDWIGEDITFPERESDEYDAGYAKALADLRVRVPELVEKIEKLIDDKVDEACMYANKDSLTSE